MFKNVLVALDGSEPSMRALSMAIEIAKRFEARLTLVHVFSVAVTPMVMPEPTTVTPAGVPPLTPAEISKMTEASQEIGNKILKAGEEMAKNAQVTPVDKQLLEGNTVQEIVKLAKEGDYDLIVVGSRGVGRLRELFVGSVSEGVLKHTPCAVLLVK